MKASRLVFAIFSFLISTPFFTYGQVLKFDPPVVLDPPEKVEINFTFQFPPSQLPNLPKYNHNSYYQIFSVFGDGNFKRYGTLERPASDDFSFVHEYKNFENNYPVNVTLLPRKDDDEPPSLKNKPVFPEPRGTSDKDFFIKIDSDISVTSPIQLTYEDVGLPKSPMIENEDIDSVALGLSHYHQSKTGGGFYYLKSNNVHVLPVAYRPKGKSLLFLFYNSEEENIQYYKEIEYNNGASYVGTLIPNYTSIPNDQLIAKMASISDIDLGNNSTQYFNGNNISIGNDSYYDRCLVYEIPQNEASLLDAQRILPPEESSNTEGELRLFHYFKTGELDTSTETASFLAVLYDIGTVLNGVNPDLVFLNETLSPENSFPIKVEIETTNSEGFPITENYTFSDYAVINPKKGEPDDPGGLRITDICNCCDGGSVVNFELTFCNAPDATMNATFAKVFLNSFSNAQGPILSDFQIQEECLPLNIPDGDFSCTKTSLSYTSQLITNPDDSHSYYISSGLSQNECGMIRFSAKIAEENINLLIQKSVMEYSVKFGKEIDRSRADPGRDDNFDQGFEVGEFRSTNIILQDTLCCVLPGKSNITCLGDPIWTGRDRACTSSLATQYNCDPEACSGGDTIGPIGVTGLIGALIAILGFLFFRFRKSKTRK